MRQSAQECKKCEAIQKKMQKVQKTIDNGYWLLIIIKVSCISRSFFIWFIFDNFDVGISICLWCYRLMLIVGTASVILADSVKQAKLMSCSGSYWAKLCPLAIFFKVEILGDHLHIYEKL